MTIVKETELDVLQRKADNLEQLYQHLEQNLTSESTIVDYAVKDLTFMMFEETYEKIYAIHAKNRRLARLNPITWIRKK